MPAFDSEAFDPDAFDTDFVEEEVEFVVVADGQTVLDHVSLALSLLMWQDARLP
jgi:hypothetical protein